MPLQKQLAALIVALAAGCATAPPDLAVRELDPAKKTYEIEAHGRAAHNPADVREAFDQGAKDACRDEDGHYSVIDLKHEPKVIDPNFDMNETSPYTALLRRSHYDPYDVDMDAVIRCG